MFGCLLINYTLANEPIWLLGLPCNLTKGYFLSFYHHSPVNLCFLWNLLNQFLLEEYMATAKADFYDKLP